MVIVEYRRRQSNQTQELIDIIHRCECGKKGFLVLSGEGVVEGGKQESVFILISIGG